MLKRERGKGERERIDVEKRMEEIKERRGEEREEKWRREEKGREKRSFFKTLNSNVDVIMSI